jgi:hypothetical protein
MPKTPSEQIRRDEQIESMQGRWKYVEELKAKNKHLIELLRKNKTGDCWCQCGIGNPMMNGNHSKLCIEIQKELKEV